MPLVTVTRNYQVTLPEEIRRKKGIKEGDKVVAKLDETGKIIITVVRGSIVDETFGSWKEEVEGIKYVDELRKGWERRKERLGV